MLNVSCRHCVCLEYYSNGFGFWANRIIFCVLAIKENMLNLLVRVGVRV